MSETCRSVRMITSLHRKEVLEFWQPLTGGWFLKWFIMKYTLGFTAWLDTLQFVTASMNISSTKQLPLQTKVTDVAHPDCRLHTQRLLKVVDWSHVWCAHFMVFTDQLYWYIQSCGRDVPPSSVYFCTCRFCCSDITSVGNQVCSRYSYIHARIEVTHGWVPKSVQVLLLNTVLKKLNNLVPIHNNTDIINLKVK